MYDGMLARRLRPDAEDGTPAARSVVVGLAAAALES
jgi:hypothetical protein